MTHEPFWDELGIAWQAATPARDVPLDRIEAHFRRESVLLRIVIGAAVLAGTAGLALGALTLWQAWRLSAWSFGTRGLALLIVAAIMGLIARTLWPVRGSDEARSLSDFVELGLARSASGLRVCTLSFAICAAAAVLGVIGAVLRTMAGHPPLLSPVIGVVVLALFAGGVAAERRRFRAQRARFVYLDRALRQAE